MALNTRRPTGAVPFPLLLVEGEEKAGKSFATRQLSASDRVGRTFVFDLGEVPSDEYAALGRFEIVEHGGTYHGLVDQLGEALAVESDPDTPNVVVLDTGTALWQSLCEWANQRARRSKAGRRILADDPDAEVDPAMNLWNDAKDRWWRVVNMLRGWPGIGIVVARGGLVTKVENGTPVPGQTMYRVEAEKGLPYAVTAQVRMSREPRKAQLVAASSLHLMQRLASGRAIDLPLEHTLEHVLFELLGSGSTFVPVATTATETGFSPAEAKNTLLATAKRTERSDDTAKVQAAAAWAWAKLDGRPGVTRAQLAMATEGLLRLQRGEELGDPSDCPPEPEPERLEAELAHSAAEAGDPPVELEHPPGWCDTCGEPHREGMHREGVEVPA